ncbi:hypothetical protein BU23DRAFT_602893 [Bimuria novae-zelandiae CBS 107.79]|uniref:Uncharacterized protein n=1 Tax=Bimuria novae-zelandiae CBS 107.79 TaxID=1447943 RepID=A0A6A5URA0_9PLEO|nr:hypothetical protein BU23DRAFT_602893 [Bimuria novae-zelandiae CBS 107.79]
MSFYRRGDSAEVFCAEGEELGGGGACLCRWGDAGITLALEAEVQLWGYRTVPPPILVRPPTNRPIPTPLTLLRSPKLIIHILLNTQRIIHPLAYRNTRPRMPLTMRASNRELAEPREHPRNPRLIDRALATLVQGFEVINEGVLLQTQAERRVTFSAYGPGAQLDAGEGVELRGASVGGVADEALAGEGERACEARNELG